MKLLPFYVTILHACVAGPVVIKLPEVHLSVTQSALATSMTSVFAHFIKSKVRFLLNEIYRKPQNEAKYLRFIDSKGGMGNQLQALAGALIAAACTGRRVGLGVKNEGSVSNWLWDDFFDPPFPLWNIDHKKHAAGRRKLRGGSHSGNKGLAMRFFLEGRYSPNDALVSVECHHQDLVSAFRSNEKQAAWLLDTLARAGLSGASADAAAERARAQFPLEQVKALPALDHAIAAALGALSWKPKPALAAALNATLSRSGPFGAHEAMALQVRACLDCGWTMPDEVVRDDAKCDLALFSAIAGALNGPANGTAGPTPHKLANTTENARLNPVVNVTRELLTSNLPPVLSNATEFVSLNAAAPLVFVTTESGAAGAVLGSVLKSAYPNARVVTTNENNTLETLTFKHSARSQV